MGAVSALRTTGGALVRNPVVFVGTFLVALFSVLLQVPQFAVQFTTSSPSALLLLVGLLVPALSFFVQPFLLGGVLGMATEAVAGETALGTFVRVGKARYVTLLLATLLYTVLAFAIAIALVIVVGIVVVVAGVAVGGGGSDPNLAIAAVIAIAILSLLVGFLLFVFFLQFFRVAVVVDGAGVTGSFSRSYRVVRRNLLSTLGYDLLWILVSLLVAVPVVVLVAIPVVLSGGLQAPATPTAGIDGEPGFSAVTLAAGVIGLLVLQTVLSAVTTTYAVAFYRDRRALDEDESVSSGAGGSDRQSV